MYTGFILMHRKILDWEWYSDINTRILFIHLLIKANHKTSKWKNIEVLRGQLITSLEHLAVETGLSIQQVRTCLTKLKSTSEITCKSTSRYSIIMLNNYNQYQGEQKLNQQENIKQVTTNNNDNNVNNKKTPPPISSSKKMGDEAEDEIKFLSFLKTKSGYPYNDEKDRKLYQYLKGNFPQINLLKRVSEWIELNKISGLENSHRRIPKFFEATPEIKENNEAIETLLKRFESDNYLTNEELAKIVLKSFTIGQKLSDVQKRMVAEIQYIHNFSPQGFWILEEIEKIPESKKTLKNLIEQVEKDFKTIGK